MKRLLIIVSLAAALVAPTAEAKRNRWPVSEERDFVVQCMSHGAGRYCNCTLVWLQNRYTYRQIVSIFTTQPTRFAQIVDRAVHACVG
jgi:hypothetical protein